MARLLLVAALIAASLPVSLLCNASPVVEDEHLDGVDDSELAAAVQQCRMLTDDNLMFHCITRERKRLEIKQELSKELAFRPLARKNLTIPESQLKKMLLKEGFAEDGSFEVDKEETAATTRIVPVIQNPSFLPSNRYRSYFNFNSFDVSEAKEAIMYFFIKGIIFPSEDGLFRYNVHIYRFRSEDDVDSEPIWSYKRMREMSSNDWDNVDVTDLVKDWGRHPETNFGLMLKVEPQGNNYDDDFDPVERAANQTSMFLEVKMNSELSRARRSFAPVSTAGNHTCTVEPNHPDSSCCRYSLEVVFSDFGWDWIIAPKRYNAYYCAGRCKTGQHMSGSNHAFFMEHRHKHRMCCSPEKLNEMKIIYMDNNGEVQIRVVTNMIVQKCSCS